MDNNIQVDVATKFLIEPSIKEGKYIFSYTIDIFNKGTKAAQLLSRHWRITDANNGVDEVRGDGVIGNQPIIKVGQSYRYTSFVVLDTNTGMMSGTYQMISEDNEEFDAIIPPFYLITHVDITSSESIQ